MGVLRNIWLSVIFGVALVVLVVRRWFRREDSSAAVRAALESAGARRTAEAETALRRVDAVEVAEKEADSVEIANKFVLSHWGKK